MISNKLVEHLARDSFLVRLARIGALTKHHCREAIKQRGHTPTEADVARVMATHQGTLDRAKARVENGKKRPRLEASLRRVRNWGAGGTTDYVPNIDQARKRAVEVGVNVRKPKAGKAKSSAPKSSASLDRLKSIASQRSKAGAFTRIEADGAIVLFKSRAQ